MNKLTLNPLSLKRETANVSLFARTLFSPVSGKRRLAVCVRARFLSTHTKRLKYS